MKRLENSKFDFFEFIKVSFHFKYYIILLLILTIIIVFFYLNNKYPNKLYVQDIYFDEQISSVMHNEILSPSSTRVLELISFKYNELYQTDKKITSLIEKNFIQENYNKDEKDLFNIGFSIKKFYDFNIFNKFKRLIISKVESNLTDYTYNKDLKKLYTSNERFKIDYFLSKLKIINSKERLIIRLESEEEFTNDDTNNFINYLTDAANLSMLYEINEFIEVSDSFNNELKILSKKITNKKINYFQKILNQNSNTENNKLLNDLLEIISKIDNDNDSYNVALNPFYDFIELLKANLNNKGYKNDSFAFFSIQYGEKITKNYNTTLLYNIILISVFILIFYSLLFYIINYLYFLKKSNN